MTKSRDASSYKSFLKQVNQNIIRTEAVDTYIHKGDLVKTLALDPTVRETILTEWPNVKYLLECDKENPLLKDNEHYINYIALTLLIEGTLRKHYPNSNNIFVVKNDENGLKNILQGISLREGEDAKIIYISDVHAIPFYLRNIQGKIHGFIVDTEAPVMWPRELVDIISTCFPDCKLTLSSTLLQKDYYSCGTMAYDTLLYFVKHGHEIFPYLEKQKTKFSETAGAYLLPEERLMPPLLKMLQTELRLPEDALDTIVNDKKKITLREYLKKHAISYDNKSYNTAALKKKYRYLSKLENYLQFTLKGQSLSADQPLPIALQKRHVKYSGLFQHKKSKLKKGLLEKFAGVINDISKETYAEYGFPDDKIITENFLSYFASHPSFNKKNSKIFIENFIRFFKFYKLVSDLIEKNDTKSNAIYDYAFKALIIFESLSKFDRFITSQGGHYTKPVHDILTLFTLPNGKNFHLSAWQALIRVYGITVLKYLGRACEIEKKLSEMDGKENGHRAPCSLNEIKNAAARLTYSRANEYPELAEICLEYQVPEKDFNDCLAIELDRKEKDNLPDVIIDGDQFNAPGYYLVKLPVDDPRAYILGHITHCCQSIGGATHKLVEMAMMREDQGFYVLLKRKGSGLSLPFTTENKIDYENFDIVGQGYTWMNRYRDFDNDSDAETINLVIDSWENKRPEIDDQAAVRMLFAFGEQAMKVDPRIMRITIGSGGKTPKYFAHSSPVRLPEVMRATEKSFDSQFQTLICFNKNLIENKIKVEINDFIEKLEAQGFFNIIDKDYFRKILSEDEFCASHNYLHYLQALFLNDQSFSLWKSLWGQDKNALHKFSDALNKHGFLVWEALYQFHKTVGIDEFNYEAVLASAAFVDKLSRNFPYVLTNENLCLIARNVKLTWKRFPGIFNIFHRLNILTPSIFHLLVSKAVNNTSDFIYLQHALLLLYHSEQLTERNIQFLEKYRENLSLVVDISESISRLSKSKLLTEENRQKFIEDDLPHCRQLTYAFTKLKEFDLWNDKYSQIIMEHKDTAIAITKVIVILKKANILNDNNLYLAIAKAPDLCLGPIIDLKAMYKNNELTNENFVKLFKNQGGRMYEKETYGNNKKNGKPYRGLSMAESIAFFDRKPVVAQQKSGEKSEMNRKRAI